MYKVTSRRIDTRRDPDSRAQIAKRFKATYSSLGLTVADVGKLLHVTPRTLHNWNAGRRDIPYAAFKLLRVLLHYELPSPAWEGWHFSDGKLYTPEGRWIEPHESSWWSLLVQRARGFDVLYLRCRELDLELRARCAMAADGPGALAPRPAGADASAACAAGAGRREAPGLDLSLRHFGTQSQKNEERRGFQPGRDGSKLVTGRGMRS